MTNLAQNKTGSRIKLAAETNRQQKPTGSKNQLAAAVKGKEV